MFRRVIKTFLDKLKATKKGEPIRPPKFKRRMSLPTARFTKGGFKVGVVKVLLYLFLFRTSPW
jgi:hypothetical protein